MNGTERFAVPFESNRENKMTVTPQQLDRLLAALPEDLRDPVEAASKRRNRSLPQSKTTAVKRPAKGQNA